MKGKLPVNPPTDAARSRRATTTPTNKKKKLLVAFAFLLTTALFTPVWVVVCNFASGALGGSGDVVVAWIGGAILGIASGGFMGVVAYTSIKNT